MDRRDIEVTVDIVRETEKALLINDGTQEVWLPKSQITWTLRRDGMLDISMPEWLAEEKGLI